ncbi:MAG: 1-acyl-sn-glycerol-3-phosphate acyltransferase [Deltaproteobacteria bacterium]|nr:1-acyl-sn-glycerol-3-phosphate acyltransferase [Deltaproteobacteria bacterium]
MTRENPDALPAASFETPTLGERVASIGLWGAGVTYLASVFPTMTVLSAALGSERIEWMNRWYCRTQIRLTGSRWKAIVDPAVDPKTPYMFAQNHTNIFDHVWIYDATPHFKQGLELESHFKIPVYGWFMKARGTIPVRPGKEGQTPEVLANMRREIDAGHSILAFPEGHRTTTGRLGAFRRGTFFIARDLGLPIVPTTVTGAFDVIRKGSLIIRAGNEVTIHVDAPVSTKGLPDSAIPELAEHVRSVMAQRIDDHWRARGWRGPPESSPSRNERERPTETEDAP